MRGVLEALERHHGPAGLALVAEKVPRRLSPYASLERLRRSAALDTLLLDDAEELLLLIDAVLGDGSGRVLEVVGQDLAARALNQGGVTRLGDLQGTVARLQAFLDHPFVETPTLFELKRTDLGFSLSVGVVGRPRATRLLRHLAVGAIAAAERAAHQGGSKLTSEIVADRATLTVRYRRSEPPLPADSDPMPTSTRRPTHSFRPPSLSEEVERILASHKSPAAPYLPRHTPAPTSYRGSPAAADRNATERTSDIQRVAHRASPPDSAPEPDVTALAELKRSKG